MKFPFPRILSNVGHKIESYFDNGYNGKFGAKNTTSPQVLQHIQNQKVQGDNQTLQRIPSYKKGGIVHKTGLAMLHKGEVVVPKHKVDKWLMSDTGIMGAKYSKSTDSENATS